MDSPATDADSLQPFDDLIARDPGSAADKLRERLRGDPLNADAYRLLAKALSAARTDTNSSGEIRTFVAGSDQLIGRAAQALSEDDLETAEIILRRRLLERPADVFALHLMANLATALDFVTEADALLQLVIEIAPDFTPAHIALAAALNQRNLPLEAAKALEPVLARDPGNPVAKALKATALGRAGRFAESLQLHEEMLKTNSEDPKLWSSYGHFLKTVGRSDEGYRAMRRAVSLAPHNGEAWWTLSNLKTTSFDPSDIATMHAALESAEINDRDRYHLNFALGKADDDAGRWAEAFAHYERANAILRETAAYPEAALASELLESIRFFSKQFFEDRKDFGAPARDPIFIVGMPRAGSTLIEQILASHPAVEGTSELPDIPIIAKSLGRGSEAFFPTIAALKGGELRALGENYLNSTRVQRLTDRPFFVDKMPNNWMHIPLIQLILPNAKIIDARRHPLACGFSNFKQLYVDGHTFSYDLATIGHHYANYVRFMAHIDEVLPGRVHRLIHEKLIDDTEGEIRRLLDHLGLPFDPMCLRFYDTDRAVRTPSSEQVRRPISRKGLDDWRAFEPWLGPLKNALGPTLDYYPDAPPLT